MNILNAMKNIRTALICGLLCISTLHLIELNHRRHVDIEQRKNSLENHGVAGVSNAVDANGSDQVLALPNTEGVYINDIEANFQRAVMQTLGETIAVCLLVMLTYGGIKQIVRIRSKNLQHEKGKV